MITFSSLSKRKSTKALNVYVYGLVGTEKIILTQLSNRVEFNKYKSQVINRVGNFTGFGHK